jgi:hypothetical protein
MVHSSLRTRTSHRQVHSTCMRHFLASMANDVRKNGNFVRIWELRNFVGTLEFRAIVGIFHVQRNLVRIWDPKM